MEVKVEKNWHAPLEVLLGKNTLRPVQLAALQSGLLENRKNYLISAPTNAGKSLVGLLPMLEAIRNGRRAVILEPLRALAQEQTDSLREAAPKLSEAIGGEFRVKISTGDYRLEDEHFSEPGVEGELIVATPERFEAILRNPDYQAWVESIGAVCVDEAHLISSPHRGPTLEFVVTSLLSLPRPPRLILLSATLGDTVAAQEWLRPCKVVQITERVPPLVKEVVTLKDNQETNEAVLDWLKLSLADEATQAIIFVYQTAAAVSLANLITSGLDVLAGEHGAVAYHSQMSGASRMKAKEAYLSGQSRVVVTTTALAMGVNLPATHVLVRDISFPGARSPNVSDMLQMMGRAGRGDIPGKASVLLKPSDKWSYSELKQALEEEKLEPFQSAFALSSEKSDGNELESATKLVSSLLSRHADQGQTAEQLIQFLGNSFGGRQLTSNVEPSLKHLCEKKLAYEDDDIFRLTRLGLAATRAVLPIHVASGFSQLIRDILDFDPNDRILGQWQIFDHLLIVNVLDERSPKLRIFSARIEEQVSAWMERKSGISMLFSGWVYGAQGHSKADQLLGSLGVDVDPGKKGAEEACRARAYSASLNAIILYELGHGNKPADLSRQFGLTKLEGIEERWRDTLLWLLSGIGQLLDLKCFFHHLKEECNASPERIKRIKRLFLQMRHQVFELQEMLKYCSPLGPILADIRQVGGSKAGVGIRSIRKLEESGVGSVRELYELGFDGMVQKGVRRDIAKRISSYLRRRTM